jgi:hypothetical protein
MIVFIIYSMANKINKNIIIKPKFVYYFTLIFILLTMLLFLSGCNFNID